MRRHFGHRAPAILDRLAADKAPQVSIESPEFFSHGEKHFRILDGGRDLKAVPHDSAVAQQPLNVALAVAGDFLRAKPVERVPIVFPLFQNGGPAQPGLRTFKNKELEEHSIIMHRDAPSPSGVSNMWFSRHP